MLKNNITPKVRDQFADSAHSVWIRVFYGVGYNAEVYCMDLELSSFSERSVRALISATTKEINEKAPEEHPYTTTKYDLPPEEISIYNYCVL